MECISNFFVENCAQNILMEKCKIFFLYEGVLRFTWDSFGSFFVYIPSMLSFKFAQKPPLSISGRL